MKKGKTIQNLWLESEAGQIQIRNNVQTVNSEDN